MTTEVIVLRLALSVLLGGLIGWERESAEKPAGLRTLTLVCVGATIFTLMGLGLVYSPAAVDGEWDPLRIVHAIIQGVGFLGAGTVMHRGNTVEGLTTAAALWVVSAVGTAVGLGMYTIASLGAVTILVVLRGPRYLRRWVPAVHVHHEGSGTQTK